MPTKGLKPTRSSLRIHNIAPPPSSPSLLLSLPPETLDLIFALAVHPMCFPRNRRIQLATLLGIHPSFTPIVRRQLYMKTTLVLGDPKGSDREFLRLLESEMVNAGRYLNFVKVRVPDPQPGATSAKDINEEPALAILPAARLNQKETVDFVARAFEKITGVRYLELDARVGTRVEGEAIPDEGDDQVYGGKARLEQLETAMKKWRDTLQIFKFHLADPHQRLQIFADASIGYQSPFAGALQSWASLTQLELWRVRLCLPTDFAPAAFKLKILRLRDVEFTSSFELEWLINGSTVLDSFTLADPVFTSTPESSSPLLLIFSPDSGQPSFADSLKWLRLFLLYPIGQPSPPNLLSSLVNLGHLDLGGAGIDLSLFASIFPPPRGKRDPATRYPSQNLERLYLDYLVHPSLVHSNYPPPLYSLRSHTFHTTLFTHLLTSRSIPKLKSLTFQPTGDFPRAWSWSQRRGHSLPLWRLHPNPNPRTDDDEAQAWIDLESPLRKVNGQRKRELRAGEVDRGPIRLFKSWSEIEYANEVSDGERGEEDEEEEEVEFDGDALFEPSSEEEAPVATTTRRPELDTDDSDF